MLRTSRRLTVALLWLALALLPLRGLAAALMPALAVPAGAPEAHVAAAMESMPCHGASAEHGDMVDASAAHSQATEADADGVAPVGDCPTCSLCVLCHGGVAQAMPFSMHWAALPSSPPVARTATALEPRAPDGLFRPPRTQDA